MAYDNNIYAKIVSGELSEEEIKQLKESGEWQEIQAILEASDDFSLKPYDKKSAYEELVKKRKTTTQQGASRIRRLIFPMASSAAILLLLFGYFFFVNKNSNKINAEYGEVVEANPWNHTKINLNDGSSIEYNTKGVSIINLQGEAYFQVVPGNKVDIKTEFGTVKVLGTKFNIRTWGGQLTVSCYEGKVAVISNTGSQMILDRNEALSITKNSFTNKREINSAEPEWLMERTRIYQEDRQEVFNELERQYNIRIERPMQSGGFSGEFPNNDLEEALGLVCDPMGYNYKIINKGLVEIYE